MSDSVKSWAEPLHIEYKSFPTRFLKKRWWAMQIYGNIICGAECEGYWRPLFEFLKKLLQKIPKE